MSLFEIKTILIKIQSIFFNSIKNTFYFLQLDISFAQDGNRDLVAGKEFLC